MAKKNFILALISCFAITVSACNSPSAPDNSTTSSGGGGGLPGKIITITQADYLKFSQCDIDKTPAGDAKTDKLKRLADVKAMSSSEYNTFLATKSETQKSLVLRLCE